MKSLETRAFLVCIVQSAGREKCNFEAKREKRIYKIGRLLYSFCEGDQ